MHKNIVKILGENKVQQIECIKTELVKKEGETREVPVDIENSNYQMDIDYVIMAIGAKTEEKLMQKLQSQGITVNPKGYIMVNKEYQTTNPKVFAGGDNIGQKGTVAWAAKSGRKASEAIEKFLEGKAMY